MPPTSIEALAIFLLFVPGFLAERVATILTPKRTTTALESLINSVGLSLLIYGIYQIPLLFTSVPSLPVALSGSEGSQVLTVSTSSIGLLVGIAIAVGVLVGWGLESGAIYRCLSLRFFGRFRATNRTGRPTVWEDALMENPSPFVDVHLRNGEIISGSYFYISERPGENEILIVPPGEDCGLPPGDDHCNIIVTGEDGSKVRPEIKGILLTTDARIERIDFNYHEPIDWGYGGHKRRG